MDTDRTHEQALARLELAVGLWYERSPASDMVAAAEQALLDGLWTPELGELAGMPASSASSDLTDLVARACADLGLPWPPPRSLTPFPHGRRIPDLRALRIVVRPEVVDWLPPDHAVPAVRFVVDGELVDPSRLGLAPHELLRPRNALVATEESHNVTLLLCNCGCQGCSDLDVRITRDGATVWWEWLEPWNPMTEDRRFDRVDVFDAEAYDAEVARFAADQATTSVSGGRRP